MAAAICRAVADAVLLLSESPELSLIAKATLVLLAGLAVTQLARHARASVRHLVVMACFAALVALPVFMAAVPTMTIDVPVEGSDDRPVAAQSSPRAPVSPGEADGVPPGNPEGLPPLPRLATALRAGWLVGAR